MIGIVKMFYHILVLFLITLYSTVSFAGDIKATKSNASFEEVAHIDQLQQISVSEVPVTTYTPRNLRSQQQLRFQGKNTTTGAMTFWSTTITDYDTKIVESKQEDNDYYIVDNTGKQIKTGEHIDLEPINASIDQIITKTDQNAQNIDVINQQVTHNSSQINNLNEKIDLNQSHMNKLSKRIDSNTSTINNLNEKIDLNTSYINNVTVRMDNQDKRINGLNQRVNKLERRLDSNLAIAGAIGSLKSNPRSNCKGELAIGMGNYRDNTAIATGLIYHFNDNIMVTGGVSYAEPNVTVGFGGITFSLF